MKIFVFAANHIEFVEWQRKIMPNCLNDFEYVPHTRINELRGIPWKNTGIIILEGFMQHTNAHVLDDMQRLVNHIMQRRGERQ